MDFYGVRTDFLGFFVDVRWFFDGFRPRSAALSRSPPASAWHPGVALRIPAPGLAGRRGRQSSPDANL